MRGIIGRIRVDRHKHAFMLTLSFEDDLAVRQKHFPVTAVIERFGFPLYLRERRDIPCQFVPLRLVKGSPQSKVVAFVFLSPPRAKLASIINARNSGNPEKHRVNQLQMLPAGQRARDPVDIMIVHEVHQMLSGIKAPRVLTELPVQRILDLKHVQAVEA